MHHTYIIPVVSVVDPGPAFQVNPDQIPVPNPDPGVGTQKLIEKKTQLEIFLIKNCNLLIPSTS